MFTLISWKFKQIVASYSVFLALELPHTAIRVNCMPNLPEMHINDIHNPFFGGPMPICGLMVRCAVKTDVASFLSLTPRGKPPRPVAQY